MCFSISFRKSTPHKIVKLLFAITIQNIRLDSMWGQNTKFLFQSYPITFYGHFELELCPNTMKRFDFNRIKKSYQVFQFQGKTQESHVLKSNLKLKRGAFAHGLLRFVLWKSQWLTFQSRFSQNTYNRPLSWRFLGGVNFPKLINK